jgi:hypothetical protein
MLTRISTDISRGVATVAGAKPPKNVIKNDDFYRAKKNRSAGIETGILPRV